MPIEPEEYESDTLSYEIVDLEQSATTKKSAKLYFHNHQDAKVVFDLMKRYSGKRVFDIPKDTPGEAALFNALGHFGVIPKQIILLKVHTVVEALDIS
jgi:hypothetical protein